MDLKEKIRVIEGFPKEGISFKDITTLVADGEAFKESIDRIVEHLKDKNVDVILGPEARGFIFGVPVAYALGVGFVPVRKKGKLPAETVSVDYSLEYGVDVLEIHKDAIKKAVAKLVEKVGAEVVALDFAIELTELKGRDKLEGYEIMSLVQYDV